MTPSQTAELLAMCAAFDQRTIGEVDVAAWAPLMAGVDQADAVTAVQQWYAEHRERITPADIRKAVRAVRATRIDRAPHTDPPPEVKAGGTRAYLAWLRRDRAEKARPDAAPAPLPPAPLPRAELDRRYGGLTRPMPRGLS